MRGKDDMQAAIYREIGITPAYAGKSGKVRVYETANAGSPPPMRGKGLQGFSFILPVGITPAYAGKRIVDCYAEMI